MLYRCAPRLSRSTFLQSSFIQRERFSTSSARYANRAVVYTDNGNPAEVLRVQSYDPVPPPPPGSINIRFRLAPINPADVNVIQGVYPAKPSLRPFAGQDVFIGGNEGLAEIVDVGNSVRDLQKGDWVTVRTSQFGTWSSTRTLGAEEVIKLPANGLSEVNAATINVSYHRLIPFYIHNKSIQVNPPTAYNMLHDFVDLKEGDWVLQNGETPCLKASLFFR